MTSRCLSLLLSRTKWLWYYPPEQKKLLLEVITKTWYLGFTCFGGPPVHFKTFHTIFVENYKWIDEPIYQELFALFQSLPGTASAKLIFAINWIHAGFRAGCLSFFMWCLPGATGMYALALGISKVGETLPPPVYALLSGLNSATVGVIALAAVHLAGKAITDKLTRLLVFYGAVAGMLYTALWYFPVLMAIAGMSTIIWDMRYLHDSFNYCKNLFKRKRQADPESQTGTCAAETNCARDLELSRTRSTDLTVINSLRVCSSTKEESSTNSAQIALLSWRRGLIIAFTFLVSSGIIIIIRSVIHHPAKPLSLFANFYLAGTIIFGGGPVVIPLLREYIVAPGWVSSRNFLMGLAIIQAFPGPNFNFAVYLGALAAKDMNIPSIVGALIGFVGMFVPGMWLAVGSMGVWGRLRDNKYLKSLLRGINAAATGLIFTAVFRLWKVGLINEQNQRGTSLGNDPWWVAISAGAFVGGQWFGLQAPLAILSGGVLGLLWYAVVKA